MVCAATMSTGDTPLLPRGACPTCALCDSPAAVAVLFVSHDQARVKAPPGKTRTIAYGLCQRCNRWPDSRRRVEEQIFADLASSPPSSPGAA